MSFAKPNLSLLRCC